MQKLGGLSASQVVSVFRHDWALLQANVTWPDNRDMSRLELPLRRFAALSSVRHPFATFPTLECIWSLAEMTQTDFLTEVRAYPAPSGGLTGALTLNEFALSFQRDSMLLGEAASQRVSDLRRSIRNGDFTMTDFVIVTAEAARDYYPASPDGTFCLLDGHHRLLALIGEERLADPVRVIVGELPQARLGVAVLDHRMSDN